MGMRASSEKRIAGAAPHITFHWWGALPKADASMKVYVPKSVSLMLAIVKKKLNVIVKITLFVLCFGVLPFQRRIIDSEEAECLCF